jgi:hypothetical protein
MVRPHMKNGLLKDGKKNIRLRISMGSRRTGRPRIRWLDDVCNDTKVLTVEIWKKMVLNMKTCYNLVQKAKTHIGLVKLMEKGEDTSKRRSVPTDKV